jgi:hypothetical protein
MGVVKASRLEMIAITKNTDELLAANWFNIPTVAAGGALYISAVRFTHLPIM